MERAAEGTAENEGRYVGKVVVVHAEPSWGLQHRRVLFHIQFVAIKAV